MIRLDTRVRHCEKFFGQIFLQVCARVQIEDKLRYFTQKSHTRLHMYVVEFSWKRERYRYLCCMHCRDNFVRSFKQVFAHNFYDVLLYARHRESLDLCNLSAALCNFLFTNPSPLLTQGKVAYVVFQRVVATKSRRALAGPLGNEM